MSGPPCLWIKTKYSVYSSFRQRGLILLKWLCFLTFTSPNPLIKSLPHFSQFLHSFLPTPLLCFTLCFFFFSLYLHIQIKPRSQKPFFKLTAQTKTKMMQRCGSYQCYSAGECSCGAFYGQQGSFFSMPAYNNYYESEHYSFDSSSPVDCTLSLGTPSTRMTEYDEKRREEQQSASNFGWDLPRTKHGPSSKSSRRGGNSGGDKSSANGDQMFARHCANCDTTTTPLWRNGPSGPKVNPKPWSNPIDFSIWLNWEMGDCWNLNLSWWVAVNLFVAVVVQCVWH